MNWTTAAPMPTGTATRIARWLESRPTPIAMGVVATFLLVVIAGGAGGFETANFGLDVV